jgi:hypothetical protein
MIFHGTVFFIVGMLAGIPYGQAIARKAQQRKVDAWRAAHTGLSSTGILTIAVGVALLAWSEASATAALTTWSMIVSGYSFCLAMTLAAWSGSRGLSPKGPLANRIVFGCYGISIVGTFIGAFAFLRLAWLHY